MDGVLIAVAIHEAGKVSLTQCAPAHVRVEPMHDVSFRIAYRLVDEAYGKQTSVVEACLECRGRKDVVGSAAMRDRPFVDDSRYGEIVLEMDGFPEGDHLVQYHVRLRAVDELRGQAPLMHEEEVSGSFYVRAA